MHTEVLLVTKFNALTAIALVVVTYYYMQVFLIDIMLRDKLTTHNHRSF